MITFNNIVATEIEFWFVTMYFHYLDYLMFNQRNRNKEKASSSLYQQTDLVTIAGQTDCKGHNSRTTTDMWLVI
jgi:hypothetical protein